MTVGSEQWWERELFTFPINDGFTKKRMSWVKWGACLDAVVAVDDEQSSIERAVVQRVQPEDVLRVFGEVGVLAP